MTRQARARSGLLVAVVSAAALVASVVFASSAMAHQPVNLGADDSTPATGPLLVDGTVSFAVNAPLNARGQTRGFRVGFKKGQSLQVQLLIKDVPPANGLATSALPQVTVTDPRGRTSVMPLTERTPFYEPYSGTNYLYLARLEQPAIAGTYQVSVLSRSTQPVTAVVGVGFREVPGKVIDR
ncbi:MAG: hypothetical protein KGN78_07735 [Actinomycetales bacterium]|nr:hypothetical protein [Actinomycetales bacterium]